MADEHFVNKWQPIIKPPYNRTTIRMLNKTEGKITKVIRTLKSLEDDSINLDKLLSRMSMWDEFL